MITLTARISTRDEVFGRDKYSSADLDKRFDS
jgi:hypothetical protein